MIEMPSQRFPKQLRLRTAAEFARVYQRRCTASDHLLLVFVVDNDLGHPRLGLSVSRKVGNAVIRNRWKRLIREAFRLSRPQLPPGLDVIVIPRGDEPELRTVMASLVRLAERGEAKLRRAAKG